jgi:hypothetical protein
MPGVAPPPTQGLLSPPAIADAARNAGWSGADVTTATAIALAESGGAPGATHHNTNGTTDYGLWQINSVHASALAQGDWRVPADNARMAHKVWADAGNSFTPWVTFTNGAYKGKVAQASDQSGLGSVGGLVGNVVDGSLLGPLSGPLDLLGKALTTLTSVEFWRRAGMLILGGMLIMWGLVFLLSQNKTVQQAAVSAGKAAAL